MARPVTSTIWVGNLPFEGTEAELSQLLGSVGAVKNLRIILDRETGRPKGFGFCEYYDKSTAESAFRNLNGAEFHGRNLRIDFAEDFSTKRERAAEAAGRPSGPGPGGPPAPGPSHQPPIGFQAAAQAAQQVSGLLGGPPASDRRVQDQLNDLLASKSRPELWEVLRLLKEFLGGDRAAARNYFAERPGLTKAVFQAQMLLGMVRTPPGGAAAGAPVPGYAQPGSFQEGPIGLAGRMAAGVPPPPPPRSAPGAGGPLGLQPLPQAVLQQPGVQVVVLDSSGQQQTVTAMPPGQLAGIPVVQAPGQPGMLQPAPLQQMAPQQMQMPQQLAQPMDVVQQQQQPLPQQQQPPSAGVAGAFAGQDPAQMQALLRQVQTMTDDQINMLPEQFRQQVLFVKDQIRLGYVKVE